MVAREGDRRDPEPLGHGRARTAGQLLAGRGADADHDAGRRRAQRVEVVPVRVARDDVVPQQRVVPGAVVLGRQPEHGGVRAGLVGVAVRKRALVADDRDELRHRRPEADTVVRFADVRARRQHRLAVRQFLRGRRLVRHQRMDLFGVLSHQGQAVDRAAAAGEDVHRAGVQRRDQPVQIVRVLVRRGLAGAVGALAPPGAARVVGDDRAVGEVPGQGGKAVRAHRRPDDQQHRLGAGLAGVPHVVMQDGPRHVQRVRLRLGHGLPLSAIGHLHW